MIPEHLLPIIHTELEREINSLEPGRGNKEHDFATDGGSVFMVYNYDKSERISHGTYEIEPTAEVAIMIDLVEVQWSPTIGREVYATARQILDIENRFK